jgi:folate-binding protein YgfZ
MASQASLPLHGAHAALGAVFAEVDGRPVVRSYGDVTGEYRAARDEAGLVDLSERGVLEVSGPQRQSFLQGMLSNDVAALHPGQGCRAALLTPKGAVQALLRVIVEEAVMALETDADRVPPLQRTLEHHRVAAPVRFAVRETAVVAILGPRADAVVAAAGGSLPPVAAEAHVRTTLGGRALRLVRASDLPRGGIALHVPPEDAAAVWERLCSAGARAIGRAALDALRVEALRPWFGSDVSEGNLLHETGLLAECHSPTKGCYVGQEIVARLSARGGNVNKALRGLRLSAPAQAGDAITTDGREVGRVTTAALSPRLGPIALGYVHRSHFAAGTCVEVGGAGATVVTAFEE